ncbi:MAG: CdaR family protein [Verrucomicrobiota bacterium]|jgi:YbbR domain-containing protein
MRRWFTTDLGWKLFSLILAVGIWLAVHQSLGRTENAAVLVSGEKQATYENLPVLVVATAADVRDFRVLPDTVAVTVSGSEVALAGLQSSQIRAVVDLTGTDLTNLLRPVDVSLPPGVSLLNVEPSEVKVIAPPPKKP